MTTAANHRSANVTDASATAHPAVIVLGPAMTAVSGVTTHLKVLRTSMAGTPFNLVHFQVGSEGRSESRWQKCWRYVSSPFALARCIVQRRPAIVHVNTSLNAKAFWRDLVYVMVAKLFGVRTLVQVHGGALPAVFFGAGVLPVAVLRTILRSFDAIVVLTNQELVAYREFRPDLNVVLVPNAIDLAEYQVARSRPVATFRGLHLIFLGRIIREKGVDEIIEAMRILRQREMRTPLLTIAGLGPMEDALRQKVADLGMSEVIRFRGQVSGQAKIDCLSQADIFLLPTFHPEGLPYALLEAMAVGTVPVVCAVGGIADVVEHRAHGLFVPAKDPRSLADAIQFLDQNRDQLAVMSAQARLRIAESYSADRLKRDFYHLYEAANAGH